MIITSIDIGIFHMATVCAECDSGEITVTHATLDNIKELTSTCFFPCCKLSHENCFIDYVDHYIFLHKEIFDKSDVILVERQPPQGFVVIQELIQKAYRDRIKLIHPSSMHRHFGISKYSYEERKSWTVSMAQRYLSGFKIFRELSRKHDLADAVSQMLYYIKTKDKPKDLYNGTLYKYNGDISDFLDQFRYTGTRSFDELCKYCSQG